MSVRRPRLIFDKRGRLVAIEPGRHSVLDSPIGPFALPVLFLLVLAAAAVWLPRLL